MLTSEQREKRKNYLGSSDLPAIFNRDPFRSGADVWLEKTGRLEPEVEKKGAKKRGRYLERALLDWAEDELAVELKRDVWCEYDIFCANLDAHTVEDSKRNVEAKSTNLVSEWGAENTDDIPERVLIQTHGAMICASEMPEVGKVRVTQVPVILDRLQLKMYTVEWNESLADLIVTRGRKFWKEHILADKEPSDFRPSLEVLKRVKRYPEKVIDISAGEGYDWFCEWEKTRALRLSSEKREKEALVMFLRELSRGGGEAAEGATLPDGRLFTYFEQTTKAFPMPEKTFRVARVRKSKE